MSRADISSRLRNFDDDSDLEEQNLDDARLAAPRPRGFAARADARKPEVRNSRARASNRHQDSSDDSHDENHQQLPDKNIHNMNPESFMKQGGPMGKNALIRGNVRRGRAPMQGGGGGVENSFVPRDLNKKAPKRPSSQNSCENQPSEEEEDPNNTSIPWLNTPKKFLDEESGAPHAKSNDLVKSIPEARPARSRRRLDAESGVSAAATTRNRVVRSSERKNNTNGSNTAKNDKITNSSAAENNISGETRNGDAESDEEEFDVEEVGQEEEGGGFDRTSLMVHANSSGRNYDEEIDDLDPSVMKPGETYTDFQKKQTLQNSFLRPDRPVKSGRYLSEPAASEDSEASGGDAAAKPGAAAEEGGKNAAKAKGFAAPSSLNARSSWASVKFDLDNGETNPMTSASRYSFVQVAHPHGVRTDRVHCTVIRERRTSLSGKMQPTYELILEETNKPIILAQKMNMNRTSNYHMFDMTRATLSAKLSKKSGNYLGKLRAKNINRTEYVLLNQNSEREELATIKFDRLSLLDQLKEGNQPRKLRVVVPTLSKENVPVPNRTTQSTSASGKELQEHGSLSQKLQSYDEKIKTAAEQEMHVLETKDPVFENGNYRLNFHGRVSMPSVKNFQMVSKNNVNDILCQFGKVDEDVFHLDFKAPLTPYQAFALALCQFNL